MDDQAIIAALRAKSDSHFTELAELDRKREETAAKISGLHKALRSLDGRFNGPTEVREILMYASDYKPRPLVTVKRRELLKRACQVLQSAPEPMKTDEIAEASALYCDLDALCDSPTLKCVCGAELLGNTEPADQSSLRIGLD